MRSDAECSPVHSDSSHRINAREDGSDGDKVLKFAVAQTKVPVVVQRVNEIEDGVKCGHGGVGEGQVHDEVVGDRPHASVRKDDPDHGDISHHRHQHHQRVSERPESHLPSGLRKLVRGGLVPLIIISVVKH